VTRLLDLVDSRLRRDEVMSFVASGPIRSPDGVIIRPTIWDEHSRKAGVVRDLEQWRSRLAARRDRLTSGDGDPESWSVRNAAFCDDLITFVTTLAADLDARPTAATWRELVAWLKGLLVRYVPGPASRAAWPELEQETVERLDLTLDLLAGLDVIEPEPTWASFRAAIEVELERTTRRVGRLGDGVLVGPLSSGIGVELDAVVVVGAVEGLAPRQVRHGVILGVAEHDRVGTDLGGDSIELQRRRYLAALAATDGPRLVTWSRGEMRRGRRQYRSRWLEGLTAELETESPSFAAALRSDTTAPAANVAEWELRQLDQLGDRAAHESPVVAASLALAVGAEAIASRRWDGLSRWSGRVDPQHLAGVLDGVLSATSLERFGSCSYQFFLSRVLRIEEREDPETRIDIDPRDRGTAVHEVLERLVRERIEAEVDVLPDDLARMAAISEQVFSDLEAAGKTGNPVHWELERERISGQLDDFRTFDAELRDGGWSPAAVELDFGFGDEPPLDVEVGDHTLRFRGAADRVDRRTDGAVHVVDYKTARYARSTDEVTAGLYQGQYLQLPLYARAARRRFGGDQATAAYWYLAQGGPSASAVVDLAEVDEWFLEALDVFTRTIHDGLFATTPGEPTSWPRPTFEACKYCAFDAVCPVDRDELAARQIDDPGIEQFVQLTTRELEG
jgi:RecB family exonuclease